MSGPIKERPILFNGEMVMAILDGRKTQLRRIVKPGIDRNSSGCQLAPCEIAGEVNQNGRFDLCPLGQPGDKLWVRETWNALPVDEDGVGWYVYKKIPKEKPDNAAVIYKADGEFRDDIFRPSIHMPRWASRIQLEITGVRIQRLKDISEEDSKAEGFSCGGWAPSYSDPDNLGGHESWSAVDEFAKTWNSIYKNWDENPWVWVIEFKRVN